MSEFNYDQLSPDILTTELDRVTTLIGELQNKRELLMATIARKAIEATTLA